MARAPDQVGGPVTEDGITGDDSGDVGVGIDPDIDPTARATEPVEASVVAAVALGGVVGAIARYEAGLIWPSAPGTFPWTTFGINVLGCALIGILIVLVSEVCTRNRLLRPLLGTGVLGGFTTFSTYAYDIQRLIRTGHAVLAVGYLAGTVAAAVLAVSATTALTRLMLLRVGVTGAGGRA